jgi:hypothetical protein
MWLQLLPMHLLMYLVTEDFFTTLVTGSFFIFKVGFDI